jgi:hypothetical protein
MPIQAYFILVLLTRFVVARHNLSVVFMRCVVGTKAILIIFFLYKYYGVITTACYIGCFCMFINYVKISDI